MDRFLQKNSSVYMSLMDYQDAGQVMRSLTSPNETRDGTTGSEKMEEQDETTGDGTCDNVPDAVCGGAIEESVV